MSLTITDRGEDSKGRLNTRTTRSMTKTRARRTCDKFSTRTRVHLHGTEGLYK